MLSLYWLLSFGLAALITLIIGLSQWLPLSWLWAWVIAINLVAFATYGLDKFIAKTNLNRLPERLLLALALAGGSLGAGLGMLLFRHKIRKRSFLVRYGLVIALQVVSSFLLYRLLLAD